MKISKRSKITSSKETADRKTDRRIFPTNVRYKGYMIRLDRGGDGYNVYDKHGELEDTGYDSIENAKEFVDELANEANGSYVRSSMDEDSNWKELKTKSVLDSDGFYTDYTLYTNGSTFICMFGDKDIYEPDQAYADYETENEEDAYDWFDNYEGFADEDDDDDLVFIDNRKSSIVNNDPSLDPGFDEYDVYSSSDIEASMGRYDDYFGQTAAATYGDLISDNLKGKTVSKRKDTANEPGGLIYEANELDIDMWDLLEALEGMCREGRAREIDDSTYEILGSSNINASRYDEKQFAIEELSLSGEVSLGNCSKSTLYRWRNEINDRLQISKCDWRVKANPKDNSLVAVPLDELNYNFDVYSSEDFEDHEYDLDHPDQEYDSAATSINSTKLPAIYRMIKLQPGTVGVDFGGGKFDNAVEYLRDKDVTLCVYDPYNRSAEHNKEVLRTLRANGGADFAINSNVLNVIKEPEARKGVLENIKKITKSGAPIYITVYEGRGDAKEGVTKSGYQLNRKTADYLEEIQEVFPDAKRRGKLIVATNKGSANSSVDIKASSEIIWDDLDWNQQIQVMKRYIRNYKGTRIFEDFADYINKPVEDIIDSFCDAESYGDIKIPERKQLDSEYRNDDIYSSSSVDANTDEYSDILEEIREQCSTKLIHIMAQYGFDESEAKQYSRVDASIEDNQYGRIEIGCELDYDGLMRVCQELDPIVQAYDPDSYFEPVDPGIAEAWINLEKASIDSSSSIQAGAYDFPEPSLDPPEYPEPEEVDDYRQEIDLHLDAVIEIDQLGDWEYQDEKYSWARCKDTKDGSWYSDEYDVFIADPTSIVERVDELLVSKLPEKEGTYRIQGDVHLEYVVSNLSKYVHSYGPDDYDEDIDTDNAYVDFDFYNSNISNFRLRKM